MSRLPAWRFRAPFEDFAGKLTGSRAREEANDCIAMTAWGHSRHFDDVRVVSAFPLIADVRQKGRQVRKVPQAVIPIFYRSSPKVAPNSVSFMRAKSYRG